MKSIDIRTELIITAEAVIQLACDLIGLPKYTGGYYCYRSPSGQVEIITQLGLVKLEDEECLWFCQEKGMRLAQNPAHMSSWQTRNRSEKKYGGAIRFVEGGGTDSFSAFPEHWDEACMLVMAAERCGERDPSSRFREIVGISNNPVADLFLRKWQLVRPRFEMFNIGDVVGWKKDFCPQGQANMKETFGEGPFTVVAVRFGRRERLLAGGHPETITIEYSGDERSELSGDWFTKV